MVKNTTGGNGSKRMARKNTGHKQPDIDMNDPLILTVSVSKALGNSRFYVLKPDHSQLICHIPNRFSGRNKHNNFVTVNSLILVSLREFENPPKNCDYVRILQPTTPHTFFLRNLANGEASLDEDIVFRNETHLIENPSETDTNKEGVATVKSITIDFGDINFDDI